MNDFINKTYEINEDLLIFSIISIAIELEILQISFRNCELYILASPKESTICIVLSFR
jgi:hypothetical protein